MKSDKQEGAKKKEEARGKVIQTDFINKLAGAIVGSTESKLTLSPEPILTSTDSDGIIFNSWDGEMNNFNAGRPLVSEFDIPDFELEAKLEIDGDEEEAKSYFRLGLDNHNELLENKE